MILTAAEIRADAAVVDNGTFDSGLDSWSTSGSAVPSSGIAVLTDSGATRSLLYQPVAAASGAFTLSFDFRGALSATVPDGAVADTFFASIYFADSLAALDVPGGVFADSLALFDLDSTGAFNVNGTLGASSKGADWVKFTLTFNSTHGFLVPVFDLRELNTTDNDSAVAIDNVVLNTAPAFTTLPQSIGAAEGSDVSFTATVRSERTVSFQWRFNGNAIPGATAATLALTNVRLGDAGAYTLAASDEFGTSASPPALLAVLRIQAVEKNAAGAMVRFPTVAGVSYTLEANALLAATGWTAVGADVAGTGAEASVDDAGATAAQRFYRLRAFGGAGTPAGYLQITIPKRKTWPAANPFVPPADDAGSVTARGVVTLDDSAAVWTTAQWTTTPHHVRLTTGARAGRVFAITAHTTTQLTLDAPGEDLTTLVADGDRYEIAPLATIGSAFGIATTPLQNNLAPGRADAVRLWNGRTFDSFFHDSTGWKSAKRPPRGQPRTDANAVLIFPDEGFSIFRRALRGTLPLTFTFSGQVPTGPQRTLIGAKGKFFVAQRFPAALPLSASNFQTLPGWTKRDSVQVWDPVRLRAFTYTHNGTNWRKGRVVADAVPIPPATAVFVIRRTLTGAAGVVAHDPPFTLEP